MRLFSQAYIEHLKILVKYASMKKILNRYRGGGERARVILDPHWNFSKVNDENIDKIGNENVLKKKKKGKHQRQNFKKCVSPC